MKAGGKVYAGPSSWLRAMPQTPPNRPVAHPIFAATPPPPSPRLPGELFPFMAPTSPLPSCGGVLESPSLGPAQFNVGVMHELGMGIPVSEAKAVEWYRKAADQGSSDAQFRLGCLCQKGRGLQRDAEAAAWFRRAAHQGHAAAQCALGWHYEAGLGVAQSEAAAAEWYQRAAGQGHAAAQLGLGYLYEKGRGVERSDEMAAAWYARGAAQAPLPRAAGATTRTFHQI